MTKMLKQRLQSLAAAGLVAAVAIGVPQSAVAKTSDPQLVWSPAVSGAYDFGDVAPGSTAEQAFKLTNAGGTATRALTINLSGAATFSVTSNSCTGTSLGPGKQCSVTVKFQPTGLGNQSGSITAYAVKPTPTTTLQLGARSHEGEGISTGLGHTCQVTSLGAVRCWGANGYGQLGDASMIRRSTPVTVVDFASGARSVSAGAWHNCALSVSGGVRCWGRNDNGQLGDGSNTGSTVPVQVFGLSSGVSVVSSGAAHACVLTQLGGVQCWGDNEFGQLGNNSVADSNVPQQVVGLEAGVVGLAARGNHACALLATGAVKCWGDNSAGALGNDSLVNSSVPVAVQGLSSGVVSVAAGAFHSCAVLTGGSVKCWGFNGFGQLGDNSTTTSKTPVAVTGLSGPVSLVMGGRAQTCAILATGGLVCWGYNAFGQLGDASNTDRYEPVAVAGLSSGVKAVATGGYHSCALLTAGGSQCWGLNEAGQLGNGTLVDSNVPVGVS